MSLGRRKKTGSDTTEGMDMTVRACVLAAGKGSRMGGLFPKVLAEASGRTLLAWVLDALTCADIPSITTVVGFQKDKVIDTLPAGVAWAEQAEQLGTGHAVLCAEPTFEGFAGTLVVTCGDAPCFRAETFRTLLKAHAEAKAACTVLTARVAPPHRYGRIVRNASGAVEKIVEAADATEAELAIDEINTGVYCFEAPLVFDMLRRVGNGNKQGEYYLPDALTELIRAGHTVCAQVLEDHDETLGVNSPEDLAKVEAILNARKAN